MAELAAGNKTDVELRIRVFANQIPQFSQRLVDGMVRRLVRTGFRWKFRRSSRRRLQKRNSRKYGSGSGNERTARSVHGSHPRLLVKLPRTSLRQRETQIL